MTRGIVISAPSSGTGKTTVALGLLAAFRELGANVQPFKCGPDYIDPAFHRAASGVPSANLDSWAMGRAELSAAVRNAADADFVIAEGSMGLFDGVADPGAHGTGASADIAALTGWPVVLVIDASGQAQSAAAVALGFSKYRADVSVAGVILNKIASPRHERLVRVGIEAIGLPVLGVVPRNKDISLPERHLGLVQATETENLAGIMSAMGEIASSSCDLEAIKALAAGSAPVSETEFQPLPPPGQRIALAQDAAFSFVYPHLLRSWRAQGAEILPFSPLADEGPDNSADCCWLPGGYPELNAGTIAAANNFKTSMRGFAETRPVHGECGGYMVLGAGLEDKEATRHEMLGLLKLETSFAKRKMHLGYRKATLENPMPGMPDGLLRGHEFHYATILAQPDQPLARVEDATGAVVPETGSSRILPGGGRVTGTFFHLISGAAS